MIPYHLGRIGEIKVPKPGCFPWKPADGHKYVSEVGNEIFGTRAAVTGKNAIGSLSSIVSNTPDDCHMAKDDAMTRESLELPAGSAGVYNLFPDPRCP